MTNREEYGRHKENKEDTANLSQTSNSERLDSDSKPYQRLPQPAIQLRIDNCIRLRYNSEVPILQREWVELCKTEYGDKSVPQYINYWIRAKEEYEEKWRGKLDNLLEPAIQSLREGLQADNQYVRSKTIDQIMKYSGNDIQKHQHLIQTINVGFTPEED